MSHNRNSKHMSLILPCYNIDQYFTDCIHSILVQKDIDKCQVICVNDGSSDGTTKLIDKFAKKHPNIIQVVENKINSGVSVSRNAGINMVKSPNIMFIDGDDLIGGQPDTLNKINRYYLQEFYDTMMSNPECGMVVGNMTFVDSDVDSIINTNRTEEMKKLLARGKTSHDKSLDFLDRRVSSCATLFRTNIIQKYNLRFRPQMIYYEDADFVTRYAISCAKEFPHIFAPTADETYYLYRRRPNSAMVKLSRHSEKYIRRLERIKNRLAYYASFMRNCEKEFGYNSRIFNIVAHRYTNTLKTIERYATRANNSDYATLKKYVPIDCIGCYDHDCGICPSLSELCNLRNLCLKRLIVRQR